MGDGRAKRWASGASRDMKSMFELNFGSMALMVLYFYPDALRPSLGQSKQSKAFPPWGCLVF